MWIVIVTAFAVFALSLTLVTKDYVRRSSVLEAQKIEAELGHSTLTKINAMADDWYLRTLDRWFGEDSLDEWLSEDAAQRRREEDFLQKNRKVAKWAEERKAALLDLGFWVMRRIALFLIWIPLWIPLALLAVYHGLQDREIKKTDFGYTSPVLNNWARRVMSLVTFITILLFLSPIAIDPLMFPLMMGFWAVAAGIAMGNIQKRI
ncbi:DUF4400 domain-containing protein [Sutterella sp.]|uniref:DUF4400 domain-containing protein n=1 Tax=Sutterella sp. TaxID=1981025 RepID=UPI003FD7C1FB